MTRPPQTCPGCGIDYPACEFVDDTDGTTRLLCPACYETTRTAALARLLGALHGEPVQAVVLSKATDARVEREHGRERVAGAVVTCIHGSKIGGCQKESCRKC